MRYSKRRGRAEKELIASEQRYRELFDNAHEGLFTIDLSGRFTSVNRAFEEMTGYTRVEMLQMTIFDVLAPEYHSLKREMLARKVGGESGTAYEVEILNREGARLLLDVSTRLIFEDGRPAGVQGIARNITERRQLELQLRQAQKMEAIGLLAGGVAHDFNNLLTVITGYTQWILDELESDHALTESAYEILMAANRASALTNQLLAFSRNQVSQPAAIDLNSLVANLDRMLRRVIGEHVQLVSVMAPGLGRVKIDSGQMEQVIINLAVNARDAMPNGGRLTIETSNVSLDAEYARIYVGCSPGPYVMLTVSDTGVGMDDETRNRIFEPFFTTKEKGKGTGLGLSTVYGIVRQGGGHISVFSEVGIGTAFKIYLPVVEPGVESLTAPDLVERRPSSGHETILLVEDEAGVRRLVRDMLRRHGYTVLEASDSESAELAFRDHAASIELLLSDVVMPEVGGRELAERLKASSPNLKVLLMSGYTEDGIVRQRILEPGIAFLQKPFTPDTLARKIREVLDAAIS